MHYVLRGFFSVAASHIIDLKSFFTWISLLHSLNRLWSYITSIKITYFYIIYRICYILWRDSKSRLLFWSADEREREHELHSRANSGKQKMRYTASLVLIGRFSQTRNNSIGCPNTHENKW